MPDNTLKTVEYTRVNGGFVTSRERIVRETPLTIGVDGRHFATAMIMATMEKEYVIGYLFSQGIIDSVSDIKSIIVKDNKAEVTLAAARTGHNDNAEIHSDLKVNREDVFACVRAILKSEIFTETEAVHSAGLFQKGKKEICITEDLGRHHALDKAIGCGLLKNIDFATTLAASTGRQPLEMIMKCWRAKIPIIATKGVPTALAVTTAEKAGITVAGLVRGDTMIVYSRPSRIE
jgi:FdhD protein